MQGGGAIDKLQEKGILFSLGIRRENIFIFPSIGIGQVKVIKIYSPETESPRMGIPVEVCFVVLPVDFFGFGANFFGNINNRRFYIGGGICIVLGKFN